MKLIFLLLFLFVNSAKAEQPSWEEIMKLEKTYQVLNAVDALQTIEFVNSGYKELNPILGPRPSTEEIIAFKVAMGVGHYFISKKLYEHSPKHAKIFQYCTIVPMGAVVAFNFRLAF